MSVALYLPQDLSNTALHQAAAKAQLLKMRSCICDEKQNCKDKQQWLQ